MKSDNPKDPSEKQIENCESAGWEYLGNGLFAKGELIGWFTDNGWHYE